MHNCALDIGLASRYRDAARLHHLTSFMQTPRLTLVVCGTVICVNVNVITCMSVIFHTNRVCAVVQFIEYMDRIVVVKGNEYGHYN
jgi:hypothetical protein